MVSKLLHRPTTGPARQLPQEWRDRFARGVATSSPRQSARVFVGLGADLSPARFPRLCHATESQLLPELPIAVVSVQVNLQLQQRAERSPFCKNPALAEELEGNREISRQSEVMFFCKCHPRALISYICRSPPPVGASGTLKLNNSIGVLRTFYGGGSL